VKGPGAEHAVFDIIVEKPEPRWFTVEVANGRVYWTKSKITPADDVARFEKAKDLALKSFDPEKLKAALAAHAKLKTWLEGGKGTVAFKFVAEARLQLTFGPPEVKREELTLTYDLEKGALE
jgi:hypothetical protein